jgi:hypothetical protein
MRLTIAAITPNIALAQLQFENGRFYRWEFPRASSLPGILINCRTMNSRNSFDIWSGFSSTGCDAVCSCCDSGVLAVAIRCFSCQLRLVSGLSAARSSIPASILTCVVAAFRSCVPIISINFPSRGLRLSATTTFVMEIFRFSLCNLIETAIIE